MIFNYVRDKNRQKIGIIVAYGPNEIGWSLKRKTDLWNDKMGFSIAMARANVGSKVPIPLKIRDAYNKMQLRVQKCISAGVDLSKQGDPLPSAFYE